MAFGITVHRRADDALDRLASPHLKATRETAARSRSALLEARQVPHGKICYLEIPANKAEDAAAFYGGIFGWKVRPRGDGNLAFDDPGGVSGTWVKEADRTPDERTRVYIMVDSIADSLTRIKAAGGTVLTPRTDIGPDMGAFAAFADPVGNEFGLYEEPTR